MSSCYVYLLICYVNSSFYCVVSLFCYGKKQFCHVHISFGYGYFPFYYLNLQLFCVDKSLSYVNVSIPCVNLVFYQLNLSFPYASSQMVMFTCLSAMPIVNYVEFFFQFVLSKEPFIMLHACFVMFMDTCILLSMRCVKKTLFFISLIIDFILVFW